MAATDLEKLTVQLSADTKKFENALNRMRGVTDKHMKAVEARASKMGANVGQSFQDSLRGAVALVGTGLGVREIQQYADAWTEAGNKIAAAGQSAGVQTRSLQDLRQGADAARTSFSDYVDLYAKLIRSASGVAKSEQEIATATDVVSKAFKAGGASTQEQIAGVLQLGQALGSGVLQGDELRSIRENAPLVAKAIADEFKTTIAGLKQLGAEGKITSDRVFKAILNAQKPVEAAFNATNATIADGFTRLKNSVTEYIGTTAEAYGVTQTINGILAALSGNITSVANAAAAAGIVLAATFGAGAAIAGIAALANPFVLLAAAVGAAAYAFTEFQGDLVPLQGSIATLGDYAVAMWQVFGDGADVAKTAIIGAFDTIISTINSALSTVGTSMDGVWQTVKAGVNAIIEAFLRLKDIVVATFSLVPAAIGDAVIGAMNAMIAGVEDGINKVIAAVNGAIGAINALGEFAGIAAIPTVDTVKLGEIANTYKGAGEKARAAFDDAINRPAKDHIGALGDGISAQADALKNSIVTRANEVAEARKQLERESSRASNFGGIDNPTWKPSTAGVAANPGSSSNKGGAKSNELDKEIEQIKERTDALNAETLARSKINPLINDYGYAMAKAKAQQELLTAATKAGREITPQLAATIDTLSTKFAEATAASERLTESQDKLKAKMAQSGELGKEVFGGFARDMRDGVSAAEALGNALNRIGDKMLDIGLNYLFDGAKAGSGMGPLGGLFSMLFDKGGYTGDGGKNEAAGIVHKGEYVFSKAAVDKIGAGNLEAMHRNLKGYANGGLVSPTMPRMPGRGSSSSMSDATTIRVYVDDDDKLRAMVERTSQRTVARSAPQIVKAANRQVVPTLGRHQQQKSGGDYRNG